MLPVALVVCGGRIAWDQDSQDDGELGTCYLREDMLGSASQGKCEGVRTGQRLPPQKGVGKEGGRFGEGSVGRDLKNRRDRAIGSRQRLFPPLSLSARCRQKLQRMVVRRIQRDSEVCTYLDADATPFCQGVQSFKKSSS